MSATNPDRRELQWVHGLAIDLGLARLVKLQSSGGFPKPEAIPVTQNVFLNQELKWNVKLHPPGHLRTLPKKEPHSGSFEWIGPEPSGSPRYLWDSKDSQTVLTTQDHLRQGYIAISYTWGRFKEGYGPARGTPWNVPIIKPDIFPNMLNQMKEIMVAIPGCRYFWVDVLCINQDDLAQKREEIGKQATTFGNAKACLSYLWSIDSDDELAHIMASFGDQWSLILTSSDSGVRRQLDGLEKLPPHIQERLDIKLRQDPWFTSLWVLQEMVLAPAQIWMTRSGRFCTVNDSIVTTHLFSKALQLMNWALNFRQHQWNCLLADFELMQPVDVAAANAGLSFKIRDERSKAQDSWEKSVSKKQRTAAELRVRDIVASEVMMAGQGPVFRILRGPMKIKQEDEIKGAMNLKNWIDWGLGEASLGIASESSRSAIIVSGVNRITSKSRAEALLAALKISTTMPGHNSSDRMTPGSLPEWLQDILPRYESSAYFYVSHS